MRYIILFLLLVIGAIVVDFSSILFVLFLFLFSTLVVKLIFKQNSKYHIELYQFSFISGLTFIFLCYGYMKFHNYEYLLGFDSINAFIPRTLNYVENSDGYFSAIKNLFENYSLFDRGSIGYLVGSILFGFISKYLQIDIYFSMQLYSLFIGSFITNILFSLLIKNNFKDSKAFKYSLLIFISSPILFYTGNISRDLHVALLYLIGINITFTIEYKFKNILYLVLVIFICTLFRPESGLFLLVLIPTYLLLTLHNKKQRNFVIYISLFILIGLMSFSIAYYNQISSVFEANQENYVEGITEGSGVISSLQRVPIAGDLASIIYNGVQPLPFWSRFSPDLSKDIKYGGEVFNIMNFPKSISSFFNWFVIVYILFWLFSKGLRRKTKGYISKPLQYQLWIGLVFLYMQSAVIAQRRLIAYYCMFYILFFIIYNHIGTKDKKQITITAIFSFIALQIIGLIYLS